MVITSDFALFHYLVSSVEWESLFGLCKNNHLATFALSRAAPGIDSRETENFTIHKNGGRAVLHNPELLQAWCDDYVERGCACGAKAIPRLQHPRIKVSIDLNHRAHMRLSSLAEALGITLSDTVVLLKGPRRRRVKTSTRDRLTRTGEK